MQKTKDSTDIIRIYGKVRRAEIDSWSSVYVGKVIALVFDPNVSSEFILAKDYDAKGDGDTGRPSTLRVISGGYFDEVPGPADPDPEDLIEPLQVVGRAAHDFVLEYRTLQARDVLEALKEPTSPNASIMPRGEIHDTIDRLLSRGFSVHSLMLDSIIFERMTHASQLPNQRIVDRVEQVKAFIVAFDAWVGDETGIGSDSFVKVCEARTAIGQIVTK